MCGKEKLTSIKQKLKSKDQKVKINKQKVVSDKQKAFDKTATNVGQQPKSSTLIFALFCKKRGQGNSNYLL